MNDALEMARIIARHAQVPGFFKTSVSGLWLIRADEPAMPMPTVYEASLCIIAQGAKNVAIAGRNLFYDASNYLIVSVDLPLVAHVVEASASSPYLCCKIELDQHMLADLVAAVGGPLPAGDPPPLAIDASDPELLDAACRLLRLLDRPESIAALAPLVQREILYRLLMGPHGAMLRHVVSGDSHLGQVNRAISLIRDHYQEPLRIAAVASAAHMSVSSLHQHFKAVTGTTPLQYQKQLRLLEARRLMLAEGVNAGSAGFAVGYDSPSQFSREYRRLFGVPPREHIARLQTSAEMLAT
jgi:AraC-like DNA-binding protein